MTTPEFPEIPEVPGLPGGPGRWRPDPAPATPPYVPAVPPPAGQPGADRWSDQIAERLFERRVVMLGGYLDDQAAQQVAARLMLLDATGDEPITVRLSSPDGELSAALMLADTIGLVGVPVEVLCLGEVGGPAVAVLAAAHRRTASFHAVIRLSEPRAGLAGRAGELADRVREHQRTLGALHQLVADATGRPVQDVATDLRAGRSLDAAAAIAYGLIEGIAPPAALRS